MSTMVVDMDQESAQKLLMKGATLVLTDFPKGSEFGVDMNVYRVGEKFKGIKMIPAGLHFVYYSAVSRRDQAVAPRTGFFFFFKQGQMVVRKWDQINEDVSDEPVSEEEILRYQSNLVGPLDQFLGPYPFETLSTWVGLTDYITEAVLAKHNPKCGKVKAVTELIPQKYPPDPAPDTSAPSRSSSTSVDQLLPQMEVEPNSVINFTPIPKHFHPQGSVGSEVTKHSIDCSYILEQMLPESEPDQVLGELQFAFITFLLGQVYDGFEHWKLLLRVLCKSDSALLKYPKMFSDFIRVLHFQLQEVPNDLFVDIVDKDNFLVLSLREFFSNLNEHQLLDESLRRRGERFKRYVTKKFKWDFEAENEDEAPVVVDL